MFNQIGSKIALFFFTKKICLTSVIILYRAQACLKRCAQAWFSWTHAWARYKATEPSD